MSRILSFVVSGGDFQRTDGCLSFIDLDVESNALLLRHEVWIDHPLPTLAVRGKGITGLCVDGDKAWACFSNVIAHVRLSDGAILDLIENDGFNDLHQMSRHGNELVIANTGNESIDTVCLDDQKVTRLDLLGRDLRALRGQSAQDSNTERHVHHVSSVTRNSDGALVVGLGRQARILNATKWSWIGPRMHAPIHDVQVSLNGETWCTTVDGVVWRITGEVETWRVYNGGDSAGWTRGLALCDEGMLIGVTAIRESNRDYFRMITRSAASQSGARLVWYLYGSGVASTIEFPQGGTRKIFSVCQLML